MEHLTPYRTYFVLWIVLLALTVTMIVAEGAGLPRVLTVGIVLSAMTAKVVLIGGWYMHLRYERVSLVAAVAGGTLLTAAVLIALIAPDGINILRSAP
jgi:caa(3)-type oxidase subunit IV